MRRGYEIRVVVMQSQSACSPRNQIDTVTAYFNAGDAVT